MTRERWIHADFFLTEENDGYSFMRRGSDRTQTEMHWRVICQRYPAQAEEFLRELQGILKDIKG